MRIIRNRRIEATPWRLELTAGDGQTPPSPVDSGCFVTLTDWNANGMGEGTAGRRGIVAPCLFLTPDDDPAALTGDLDAAPVIALAFDNFTDGRNYSTAMELRQRHRYRGEIRALHAEADNLALVERCGVNAFQFRDGVDLESMLEFFHELEPVYEFAAPVFPATRRAPGAG